MMRVPPTARPWYWDQDPEPAPRPAFEGPAHCDVAVVGGGLAGVTAALELAERGYRVLLLEAERIGSGASGRSGAQALPGVAASQRKLEQLVCRDDARRIWDMTLEGLA